MAAPVEHRRDPQRLAGPGLGNQFLAHIRESDAICQVVRMFADPDVTPRDGDVTYPWAGLSPV